MSIPEWINKVAADNSLEKDSKFSDEIYTSLLKNENLNEEQRETLDEISTLLDVCDVATKKLHENISGTIRKEAAPKLPPAASKAPETITDEDLGMTPDVAEALHKPKDDIPKIPGAKIPPKVKQPETTKWKEIRFNKRTGTWQTVVTIRHTRNFLTEDEAVDFTKKAGLDANEKLS